MSNLKFMARVSTAAADRRRAAPSAVNDKFVRG